MTLEQWQESVPDELRGDALWKVEAYRLALFLSDLAWSDCTKLMKDPRTHEIADQLYRASGKISAHIAEGYSRGSGKERAQYYSYALGSLRESRDWYYKSRHVLGTEVTEYRLKLTTSIIRLVLVMLTNERQRNRKIGTD